MKKYIIMGSHPGDGGVYEGNDPFEAFARYCIADGCDKSFDEIMKDLKDDLVSLIDHGNGYFEFGDYEIKEMK